jgi:SAM-dependent methyltransferase
MWQPVTDDRHRLRATFEEVPDVYDRARPTYPAPLFDDLVDLAGLAPGSRVVEVGCGTGQATVPLARRGLQVTCVELGEGLAELARRKVARLPSVEVVNAAFESWEPGAAPYDAVVAFTSLHWIDPDARYAKPAQILRPGGALAFALARTVLPAGGDAFWIEVQEDYDAVVPSAENRPPPRPDEVGEDSAELDASGLFEPVAVRRHLWEVEYTADEYLAVLNTYSGHRSIAEPQRGELLERIRRRIESRPRGRILSTYLALLHVARRR